ncbi:MAG: sugar phosphate isomerase/epimerase [Armatimonadetes bacterium]|nr:sugar phosphate isomerase/epimerase [Armatimonadota bacterium]
MVGRVGFRTAGFRGWPLRQALQCLRDLGYDGVELCLEHPDMRPETLSADACIRWSEAVAETGLDIASVSYHGDGEPDDARSANQVRAVHITADCGAKLLILNGQKAVPGKELEQWRAFVRHLRDRVLPLAADLGIRVALEPEPGHFLHASSDLLRLLAELGSPAAGANLDVGHAWLTDPDVLNTVQELKPWLYHIHWEDMPAGEHRHLVPGTGDMPLDALHEALTAVGYSGYYTVDLFDIADDPKTPARRSLAALRKMFGREDKHVSL